MVGHESTSFEMGGYHNRYFVLAHQSGGVSMCATLKFRSFPLQAPLLGEQAPQPAIPTCASCQRSSAPPHHTPPRHRRLPGAPSSSDAAPTRGVCKEKRPPPRPRRGGRGGPCGVWWARVGVRVLLCFVWRCGARAGGADRRVRVATCADGQAGPTAWGWQQQQLGTPALVVGVGKAHTFDRRRRRVVVVTLTAAAAAAASIIVLICAGRSSCRAVVVSLVAVFVVGGAPPAVGAPPHVGGL